MAIARRLGRLTALRDIPGDVGGVFWIRVIGSHLSVYAHAPQRHDNSIGDGAEKWIPDVESEHDRFDEEDKSTEYRDSNVEIGDSVDS